VGQGGGERRRILCGSQNLNGCRERSRWGSGREGIRGENPWIKDRAEWENRGHFEAIQRRSRGGEEIAFRAKGMEWGASLGAETMRRKGVDTRTNRGRLSKARGKNQKSKSQRVDGRWVDPRACLFRVISGLARDRNG
jgi:hypothetical protein